MTFADRLAVMRAGRLEQEGVPEDAYLRPRTAFVASFLGRTNLLRGEARGDTAATSLGRVPLTSRAEGPVLLSLRPEDLRFAERGGVPVAVTARAFKGHDLTYRCTLTHDPEQAGEQIVVQTGPECALRVGDAARLVVGGHAVPLDGSRT